MDLKYFVLGLNITLISALLALYGLLINSSSLVGLFASNVILGLVIIAISFSTKEGLSNVLLNYSNILTRYATLTIEEFELLEAMPALVKKDDKIFLVLTNSKDFNHLEAGLGFNKNLPYLAIPVDDLMNDIEKLNEDSGHAIEAELGELLTEEFPVSKRVRVEYSNKTIKISLIEIDKRILDFYKYPLDPVTFLMMIILNRLTDKNLLLKNKSINIDQATYEFEVLERDETS
ncbi:MAG: hypothetical protein QW736_01185 [Fervidicoccaceae archaeon]